MLKKYLSFLLLTITFTACSFFGSNKKQHMIWEVRTPNSTAFLVGSIHLADSSMYPLDNIYYEKLDSSEIFVTEVAMEEIDPMSVLKLIMLKDGTTLKDHVPADIYKELAKRLEKAGIPEQAYQLFKPGFALMMAQLVGDGEEATDFADVQYGIDAHLAQRAEEHKKLALEDIGSQLALLEKIIDVDTTKMRLYLEADQNNEANSDLKSLMEAWKNADTDKIVRTIKQSEELDEDAAKLMEEILYDRNRNMAKKINSYLVDGGKFYIVVGAAHLCGDDSIIELLENMGYTVNQL